ncbi:MBL fold metallo-hydrolase [Thalassobellus sediminis]|uniref:MBL fold metallo-hydrolase n=1 Tax=Thalassobellus sediminis TaxID=3367753 RepID=UPI0037A773B7
MKITFYGHASLGIQIDDVNILVDPFITGNPNASSIDINTIKADYILVTHAHQDHILDVEAIAKRTKAIIISNYEIVTHFGKLGLEGHPMNHGGTWDFDFGTVKYVNAILASDFVACDKILGCHYDTFGYIEIDHEAAKRKFFEKDKDLMLLEIGASIEL